MESSFYFYLTFYHDVSNFGSLFTLDKEVWRFLRGTLPANSNIFYTRACLDKKQEILQNLLKTADEI